MWPVLVQRKGARVLCLALLLFGPTAGVAPAPALGADASGGAEGQMLFDRAQTFLLRKERGRALQLFEQAEKAGGPYADLSRLHRIRLLATESRKDNETRSAAVRKALEGFTEVELGRLAWFLAATALYEGGEREEALDIALDAGRRFEGTRWGSAARFFAAEIFFENGELSSCTDLLLKLLDNRENRDLEDAAVFLLARVYLESGDHHSPRRATHLLERFLSEKPSYRRSLWRGSALRLLATIRTRY